MSNWRPIVLADLETSSVSGKVAQIRLIAAARSIGDPAPAAIANITQELRAVIGFSGRYQLDATVAALPAGLVDLAVKKIVRDMSRTVNLPLTADEQGDERTYESRLDKIRQGNWPIDRPDTAIATPSVQTSVVTPVTKPRCGRQQFSRPGYE